VGKDDWSAEGAEGDRLFRTFQCEEDFGVDLIQGRRFACPWLLHFAPSALKNPISHYEPVF
jgi:hypothetical protein